jgi:phage terminase large subunit-like protein
MGFSEFFDCAIEGITMTPQTVTVTIMTGFFNGRINGK